LTEEKNYNLKKSIEALGQLVPCLKDADGIDIDGLHRLDDNPDAWVVTHKHIDTPLKRSLARVAVNFCRRTMSPEELRKEIGFQIGCGLKSQDIADQTGIGVSTIYLHMPEHLKDKKKVDAGKVGGEAIAEEYRKSQDSALSLEQTVKTQDMPARPAAAEHPVTCDSCPIGTGTWFPYRLKDGRTLCPTCFEYLWKQGKVIEADLLKEGDIPQVPIPKEKKPTTEVKEYKPKETAEFRRALMHPGVSKMELAVLEELHKRGHKVEFQKEVCLEKTVVDFIVDGKPVYLDGRRVHRNREWTDERIRERLAKILGNMVYAIPYERFTQGKIGEIVDGIEEVIT